MFISNALLKIPQELENQVWSWVKQQYALRLLPFVTITNPFITDNDAQLLENQLESLISNVNDAILLNNLPQQFQNVPFPIITRDFTYQYSSFSIKKENSHYKFYSPNLNINETNLMSILEKLKNFLEQNYNMVEPADQETIVEAKRLENTVRQMAQNGSLSHQKRFDAFNTWITVNLSQEPSGSLGTYHKTNITLYLYDDLFNVYNLSSLSSKLSALYSTTTHELRHAVQDLSHYMLLTGLPKPKIREKTYDAFGRHNQSELPHSLKDIEFHTNLADEIIRFNFIAPKIDPKYIPLAIKLWTNTINREIAEKQLPSHNNKPIYPKGWYYLYSSPFFEQLHNNPLKWKEAVKHFIKEVL